MLHSVHSYLPSAVTYTSTSASVNSMMLYRAFILSYVTAVSDPVVCITIDVCADNIAVADLMMITVMMVIDFRLHVF
jgi:hypothetical protein